MTKNVKKAERYTQEFYFSGVLTITPAQPCGTVSRDEILACIKSALASLTIGGKEIEPKVTNLEVTRDSDEPNSCGLIEISAAKFSRELERENSENEMPADVRAEFEFYGYFVTLDHPTLDRIL